MRHEMCNQESHREEGLLPCILHMQDSYCTGPSSCSHVDHIYISLLQTLDAVEIKINQH